MIWEPGDPLYPEPEMSPPIFELKTDRPGQGSAIWPDIGENWPLDDEQETS